MLMRRKAWFGRAVMAAAVLALAACSSDVGGSGASLASLGVDDGASKGLSKSAQVNGEKDVRLALDTGALVDVPAGAVSKEVKLTIERPSDTKALELVEKFKKDQDRIVSAPYVLTPHGTKFKEDVTVTLPLAKQGKAEVQVAWLEDEDDTEWKLLGTAKTDGKKAQITVKHFSVLVVIEDASDLKPVEDVDEPAADAGGVEVPDAGETPDASGQPLEDASAADAGWVDAGSTLDAGADLDAGAQLDASDPIADARSGLDANDAGSSTSEAAVLVEAGGADATPPVEAGTDQDAMAPDSGVVPVDGGVVAPPGDGGKDAGPLLGEQYADLQTCGRITTQGNFWAHGQFGSPFDGKYNLCLHQCFVDFASCQENVDYRCGGLDAGSTLSPALDDCVSSCPEPLAVCPNDSFTEMNECDGVAECPFGVDEQNCDPRLFFTCQGAERIPWYQVCDTLRNCSGGQDEQGCFWCDGASHYVPPYRVCDGVSNCDDGSDEAQGCAVVQCVLPD